MPKDERGSKPKMLLDVLFLIQSVTEREAGFYTSQETGKHRERAEWENSQFSNWNVNKINIHRKLGC